MLATRSDLCRCWASVGAAGTAVEADAIDCSVVVDDSRVVGVADDGDVHVGHGAVVVVVATAPIAAEEPNAGIAEAVVNSAVEADCRSPVAFIPDVVAVFPSPIAWSPQQAFLWRKHPCAGDPEVAVGTVSPVAWSPEVARSRTEGLF